MPLFELEVDVLQAPEHPSWYNDSLVLVFDTIYESVRVHITPKCNGRITAIVCLLSVKKIS